MAALDPVASGSIGVSGSDAAASPKSEIDAFLLYNEEETGVEAVADGLRASGIRLHYSRRDAQLGERFAEVDKERLLRSKTIIVLLGSAGWGPTQRTLTADALNLGKPIIPALIGTPSEAAIADMDGLFRDRLYEDLVRTGTAGYARIGARIRGLTDGRPASDFARIIGVLVDGSDEQRDILLQQLNGGMVADVASLAVRLRDLISRDFSPAQQERFATAARDPSRIPSIRAWMLSALISVDLENPETWRLALTHLTRDGEPDRHVRFWCLAGLASGAPDRLGEVVKLGMEDGAEEVRTLAMVLARPNDDRVVNGLREKLAAETFESIWHVLRVLRVAAVPQLAPEVCGLLERTAEEKSLAYDALFALANPEMLSASRSHLAQQPGIERLAAIVLEELRDANPIATRQFADLLADFDEAAIRRGLLSGAADPAGRRIAADILRRIATNNHLISNDVFVAGYASDTIDVDKDDIGIQQDVKTLAVVALSREVTPPLAIGLFGAWGSGKSFFMRSIEKQVKLIADKADKQQHPRFCGKVVQITFNAWHYNDANLWASLVSHILDQLAAYVSPTATAAQQQAAFEEQLADAKREIAAAEEARLKAQHEIVQSEVKLEQLKLERLQKEVKLRDLRVTEVFDLLTDNADLKQELREALETVGAPAAFNSVEDLRRVVEESYSLAGRMSAFFVGLVKGQNRWLVILCILLVVGAPLLIGWLAHTISEHAAFLSSIMAEIAVLAGSAAAMARNALKYMQNGFDKLASAKNRVDKLLAEKRDKPTFEEQKLQESIAQLRVGEQAASARAAEANTRAVALESRVAELKETQTLGYFLAERTRSEDYRRHLGLLSIIRRDFDVLVARLQTNAETGLKNVERIVLYIDDLDRCESKMVVDVLKAVHLLLAYPLFVVVVSVDPRWLMHSLKDQYVQFGPSGDDGFWGTTPLDYLEKIFQIPYCVRPMSETGYERLMRRLLAPGTPEGSVGGALGNGEAAENESTAAPNAGGPNMPTGAGDAPQGTGGAGNTVNSGVSANFANLSSNERDGSARKAMPNLTADDVDLDAIDEALVIREVEADFANQLRWLIPTPRAAKRFANVYRLLKAQVARNRLAIHEGSQEVPGEFQVPMLLLAVLIGNPQESSTLFEEFRTNARKNRAAFWEHARDLPDTAEVVAIRHRIGEIASARTFPRSHALLLDWLPKVGRFSFATAGLLVAMETAAEQN